MLTNLDHREQPVVLGLPFTVLVFLALQRER
jgi:hypothetical protein